MKNIIVFFICLISSSLFSQEIKIIDENGADKINDTVFVDAVIDALDEFQSIEIKSPVKVINNTFSQMVIGLTRYEGDIVSGTGDAVCWGQTCYGEQNNKPVWQVGDTAIVDAGDTAGSVLGGFVTYHFPRLLAGKSTYRYEFYRKNGLLASSSFYVQFRTSYATSVLENALQSNEVSVFPNPVKESLVINISNKNNSIRRIEVKNLLGKTILDELFINNEALDVSSLSPGVYFLNLISNNQTIITKKFIKK